MAKAMCHHGYILVTLMTQPLSTFGHPAFSVALKKSNEQAKTRDDSTSITPLYIFSTEDHYRRLAGLSLHWLNTTFVKK